MSVKIKVSYEQEQELEAVKVLLAPMLRNVKVQPLYDTRKYSVAEKAKDTISRQTYSCKQCLEMLRLKINNVDKC